MRTFLALQWLHLISIPCIWGYENLLGKGPKVLNVAKHKRVHTSAIVKSCGHNSATGYCEPAASEEGLSNQACSPRICQQKCRFRDKVGDPPLNPLIVFKDVDTGPCVVADYLDSPMRGGFSFRFENDPLCRIIPGQNPTMGENGQFTLTAWLKQGPRNLGTLFEKIAGRGRYKFVILTLIVKSNQVLLQFLGSDNQPHYESVPVNFPQNQWTHIAVQVFGRDMSIFINGTELDGTPYATIKLPIPMLDVNIQPVSLVGQRIFGGTHQYVGRMQDYYWFDKALTNREIQEIATGDFPKLRIQSHCLCPPDAPRTHPIHERNCIPNGVADTNLSVQTSRLDPNTHPLEFMTDGDSSTTWISRPDLYMPGGFAFSIDLENGEYEIFHISILFYSPQPEAITISRNSSSTARELEPWGYFANNCELKFKYPDNGPLPQADSVNCVQFANEGIPTTGGNFSFTLLSRSPVPRPGSRNFYGSPRLMNFVKASVIQIRFDGQYFTMKHDVSVQHQYYGVSEVEIHGRCNCHGHASDCDTASNPYRCKCFEESNTDGHMCERCKPLYNNKEFRIGDSENQYPCKKCDCNDHADGCFYDRANDTHPDDFELGGGGVCIDCKHNTMGRHCEQCKVNFYREPYTPLNAERVCLPCRCRRAGTIDGEKDCEKIGGQCFCKSNVTSRRCDTCKDGFYNLNKENEHGCETCSCMLAGTINRTITCVQDGGKCGCKKNVRERDCSLCQYGFKNLTDANPDGCEPCSCNAVGAMEQFCNPNTGQCNCRANVRGMFCDECEDGFWGLSGTGCQPCACGEAGTEPGTICNKRTGQCVCKANTQGRTCSECLDTFYNLNAANRQGCEFCNCDARGTLNGSLVCDKTSGKCDCKANVGGRVCNLCKGNTFGLRASLDLGCEACNCDPMGTSLGLELQPHELVCDSNSGQCACLPSREGRRCDQCSPGFYLPLKNETGCLVCDCHPVGSVSQVCNNVTGMCPCKPVESGAGLTGRRCDRCAKTFWNFHRLFGLCEPCDCDVAGSEEDECNVITGQCPCKGNVMGQHCDTCRPGSSQLNVNNPMGCYSHPKQQAAPTETNVTSRWISMTWNPPDYPNGDVLSYKLSRNGKVVYNFTDVSPFGTYSFNDTGLLPYTNYDYSVETSNIGGSAFSPNLRVRTLAGIPTGVPPLTISNVRSRRAMFQWGEPEVAHGPIVTYVLQSVTPEAANVVEVHYQGLSTLVVVDDLVPFTNYSFTLRACTSGGCGNSEPVVVLTPEAKPEKQRPPTVIPISNTTLQVTWGAPDEPNGIIRHYEVMMRGKPGRDGVHRPLQRRVFESYGAYNPRTIPSSSYSVLSPPDSNFTVDKLRPFTEYEFLVSSANSLGSVESSWTTARTLEGTPVFMHPPILDPISSFEMNITWRKPHPVLEARGDVVMYQVILTRNNTSGNPYAPPTEDVVIYSCGPLVNHFLASGFKPFSTHTITMKMCNSISCTLSSPATATTLPAAPDGQLPPILEDNKDFISLSWMYPDKVNGPRPTFMLLKSRVALSSPPLEMTRGVRFPGHSYVRFPSHTLPRDASYTGIELWFRTFHPNSLLFLAMAPLSSGGVREEYIVLQLRDGRPWFLFDAQNNPTAVTTSNDNNRRYDDGEWHRVEANRFNLDGFIEMDGIYTGSKTSRGTTTVIGGSDAVYVGGVPSGYVIGRPDDDGDHKVATQNHIGCIKDIRVQRSGALGDWSNVTWEEGNQWYRAYPSWQGCPINLDRSGAHFLGRGFLTMSNKFGVLNPASWVVKLSLRTEFTSGILFYATGNDDDFIMATLQDSSFRLLVASGSHNVTEATFKLSNVTSNHSLCDNGWHDVTFQNTRSSLSITVDDVVGEATEIPNAPDVTTFDLSDALYVGGVPAEVINKRVAILDDDARSFGGCMGDFIVDDRSIDLALDSEAATNVDLDGCPGGAADLARASPLTSTEGSADFMEVTFSTPTVPLLLRNNTCMQNPIDILYTGMKHGYDDLAVSGNAFTRYLYKVTSFNAGGQAQSEWMVTRSGEGVPQEVATPFNEESRSGREIFVEWKRPLNAQGVIANYTLSASRLHFGDNEGESTNETKHSIPSVVSATFLGDRYSGVIQGLLPWTKYSLSLTACTLAGCSSSAGSIVVMTLQEIPEGVGAPTAEVNASSMTIQWMEPEFPNGRILRYVLYHNESEVYRGLETHFNIRNLPIFTRQNFRLDACTTSGCNASDDVILFSGQLPPSHVDQPMVTVLGSHKVEVRWLEPAIMNGIFKKYVIYLRDPDTEDGELGRVVYESNERMLFHSLDALVAGTQYFITLAACTDGGCKLSSATPCRTIESVPEGIPPPDVVSQNPHSFDVSWSEPELPNGVVTLYTVYMNGILFHNSTKASSTIADRLTPWSRHTFRVRVCTKKGCSFGPSVSKRTQESPPTGNVKITVTVLGPRKLQAKWTTPGRQNGLMRYSVICEGLFYKNPDYDDYTTVRESRVMLNSSVTDKWETVEGLIPHSEYIVKVNASNGAGYVVSNMRNAKMPPGEPDGVMRPTLRSHSPYSILASWKDPARNNAPGNSLFQLEYRPVFPLENEKSAFDSVTRRMSFNLTGLKPHKEYEFQLIATNSKGSTYSGWTSIFTKQSTPGPLDPPIVYQMDAWSLHVTWESPSDPNGIIAAYKLFENQKLRGSLPGNVTEFLADSLTPFTSYLYRVEACTEAGCTSSNDSRRVRTSATAPQGLSPPSLRSDTPSSVFVTWRAPELSNGILDSYHLERRINESEEGNSNEPKLLGVFVPSQSLRYIDEDDVLRPFTSYEYRVIASTLGGGTTTSQWATVKTKPGRPEGILAPTVTILGSETALIGWASPLRENGPITKYEISFPEPRVRIDDVTVRERNVTNLIPFTNYQVKIIACTTGGCTESPSTHAQTLAAVPRGLDTPIATAISERIVNVQWKEPSFPNGPGIYYELSRTILSQPLLPIPPPYINITQTVFAGIDLVYVDRALQKYTTCEYGLSVFNRIGSFASNATQVTTHAGYPRSGGVIQAAVHNHTSVLLWWEPPDMYELQGEVHEYVVRYNSTNHGGGQKAFSPNMTSCRLSSLHPGTEYKFELDVDNGAHVVTSQAVYATTDDGAPAGVSSLVIYSLSPTQLRASWLPPESPNGRIIAYNIIIDGVTIRTNLTEASAYVIEDLRPYTVYTLKLQVCTVYACAESDETKATTRETNPAGMSAPKLKLDGRSVEVLWIDPSFPNGIIRNYQVQRRTMLSCNEITPDKVDKTCKYVKCTRGEKTCGSRCYSPTQQVCCNGKLHRVEAYKECCDDNYVAVRSSPSDVCCGGKFHRFLENHQCCHGKLLKVNARETCCKDPVEDRVSVGVGDSCCGGVPYFDNGLQLCCGGELHDGFKRKCCGGDIISDDEVCCGDSAQGASFDADESKMCCGMQYLPRNNTVCCHGYVEVKAHRVENSSDSSMKCCSGELIQSDQSCCNGVGYNPVLDICADVATTSLSNTNMPQSCGEGTLCPLGRSMFAACDRCDIDREIFDCFRTLIDSNTSPVRGNDDVCPTPFVTIYSGPPGIFSHFDDDLEYFKRYEYKIVAENKVGVGESDVAEVTTPESRPDVVGAPDWTSKDRDTITLSWKPPKKPNGDITHYVLMRNGLELWMGSALRHTDSRDVLSYREYEYILKACTIEGCTSSSPVRATSVQGVPQYIAPPRITVTGPRSILAQWIPPARSNGVVQRYLLNETNLGTLQTLKHPSTSPEDLQFVHSQLDPYTSYTYTVTACTSVGCTHSGESTATTSEAPPEGVWHRSASLPINATAVELFWMTPEKPNGVIREYRLLQRIIGSIFQPPLSANKINSLRWKLVVSAAGDTFTFTDVVSLPGATLQYQLVAINSAGYGVSGIVKTQLPGVVPDVIPTVIAQALSPNTVQVDWSLQENEEFADQYFYEVVVQELMNNRRRQSGTTVTTPGRRSRRSTEEEFDIEVQRENVEEILKYIPAGQNQSHLVEGLKPYTQYNIRVRTCFMDRNASLAATAANQSTDCNVGLSKPAQTLSAPPSGQEKPKVLSTSARSVEVSWQPPADVNGVITGYRLYRRLADPLDDAEAFEKLVYVTTDEQSRSYTDNDRELRPYTHYQYQVRVANDVSETRSEWSDVTTLQDEPDGIEKPSLEAVSAFAVSANWLPPRSPNGRVTSFRLEYQEQTQDPTYIPPILTAITTLPYVTSATFSGLQPFTTYRVRVVAVNKASLEGSSQWEEVTTLAAPPSEVGKPSALKIPDGRSLLLTWEKPAVPNGEVETYHLYEVGFEEAPIYSGLARRFHFRRLEPYTEYELVLEACTGRDLCARSPPTGFRTAETAPESQPSPVVSFSNSTAIMVSWTKPARSNGRIVRYQVIRTVIPRSSRKGERLIRKRSLQFSDYSLLWHEGDSRSSWDPFVIRFGDAFATDRSTKRVRRQIDDSDVTDEGNVVYEVIEPEQEFFNYSDSDLRPFTKYGYRIRTSTSAGSVESDWVYTETHQDAPEGIQPPKVERPDDNSPTSLVVTWELPDRINGDLQTFRIQRNETPPLSFSVSQFRFVDERLQPYTTYGYTVTACTAGGCTTSDVTTMKTYEQAPLFVEAPRLVALNSSSIEATWEVPETANGIINQYRLHVEGIVRYEGLENKATVTSLKPYKFYYASVEACTNSGCRESENEEVRTDEAPPSDMMGPELHVTSPNSIEVIWGPPRRPNGAIVRYEVRRNDELIDVNDGGATRYHDFKLKAGTKYTYVISAYNSKGSVRSAPPVSATTDPSAPSGLNAPFTTSLSSSSVRVQWDPPANPNGVIVNYTLFVRQATTQDGKTYNFTGSVLFFNVLGLEYFEEYFFWVRACTDLGCSMSERSMERTMESPPANQLPPLVTTPYFDQLMLVITWSPPRDPNGVITGYSLKRKRVLPSVMSTETLKPKVIADLMERTYTDRDLSPYTLYQYQVVASNGAGNAPSSWSSPTRSSESAPEGVPSPSFSDVKSESVRVSVNDPSLSNGIVRFYHVFIKPNSSSSPLSKSSASRNREQTVLDLRPVTTYKVVIEMCTLETMCSKGEPAYVTTLPAAPQGQAPPQVIHIGATTITLSWSEPEQSNGRILRYQLEYFKSCPPSSQPFDRECAPSPRQTAYSGRNHSTTVGNLLPYARYAFRVTSYNPHGNSQSTWEITETAKSEPAYVNPFTASNNISMINVWWSNSFMLNGVLMRYELYDRGELVFSGVDRHYYLRKTSAQVHEFKVMLHTDVGAAESPLLIYDTTKGGGKGVLVPSNEDDDETDDGSSTSSSTPFYQTMWFILVIVLAAMVIIVVALVYIMRRMGQNSGPYVRHHTPPKQPLSGRQSRNSMIGLQTFPSYPYDSQLHEYSTHGCPVNVPSMLDDGSRVNQSYSADSFNRSTNRLIGRNNASFDQSLCRNNGMRFDDQWERVSHFDDDVTMRDGRFGGKLGAVDSGLFSNFENVNDEDVSYDAPKLPIELVDTHI